MERIIEETLNGQLNENDLLQYVIDNGADEQMLCNLGFINSIKGKAINANVIDYIQQKCRNNKKLFIGILALMLSSGQLYGYTIKDGDNLWNIAKSSNCSISQLYQLNPGLKQMKYIKPGMKIIIPSEVKGNVSKTEKDDAHDIYTVCKGDTFSGIALSNNMTMKELMQLNPQIKDINKLKINDKIKIKKQTLNMDAALKALREVESKNGSNAKDGDNGKAVGEYQLWQIFVDEYHRLGGKQEYKCNVVDGVAQQDDVRRDKDKCQEMIKFVFQKMGYRNMMQVIKGYTRKGKLNKSVKIPGWNSGADTGLLQKYLDAYEKYK